jgi:hypothetical protein
MYRELTTQQQKINNPIKNDQRISMNMSLKKTENGQQAYKNVEHH